MVAATQEDGQLPTSTSEFLIGFKEILILMSYSSYTVTPLAKTAFQGVEVQTLTILNEHLINIKLQ